MSFVKTADSLKSKAHLSHIPTSMILGAACLALLAVVGIGVGFVSFFGTDSALTVQAAEVSDEPAASGDQADSGASSSEGEDASESVSEAVTVYVSGEVQSPGVYELPGEARVDDAVKAAGGLTKASAADAVNLARLLADGEQVHIPSKKEAVQGEGAASAAATPLGSSAGSDAESSASAGLVNINSADATELDTLPGVGPATAEAIIAEREENGPFSSPEDIRRVSGIGEKKYEKMKDSICV